MFTLLLRPSPSRRFLWLHFRRLFLVCELSWILVDSHGKEKTYYDSDSEDEAPKQKRRAKKKKKDPNAPKRPTSAYFYYAGDVRPGIREENPDMKITQVMSQIGAQWRELTDEDKKPYEEQAAKDRKRYENEMKEYNGV